MNCFVPHSRHTEVRENDIRGVKDLTLLANSEEAGVHLVIGPEGRQVFALGHSEYSCETLKQEYERDRDKGLNIDVPKTILNIIIQMKSRLLGGGVMVIYCFLIG